MLMKEESNVPREQWKQCSFKRLHYPTSVSYSSVREATLLHFKHKLQSCPQRAPISVISHKMFLHRPLSLIYPVLVTFYRRTLEINQQMWMNFWRLCSHHSWCKVLVVINLTLMPLVSSSSKEPMSNASAAFTSPLGGIKGGEYCRYGGGRTHVVFRRRQWQGRRMGGLEQQELCWICAVLCLKLIN